MTGHGTERGYQTHIDQGEDACTVCRDAHARQVAQWRARQTAEAKAAAAAVRARAARVQRQTLRVLERRAPELVAAARAEATEVVDGGDRS